MSEICSTCLSRDRILVPLDKVKYVSIFGRESALMSVDLVCWECSAMFRKLFKFRLQVLTAQETLNGACDKITNLAPLTNIKCSSLNFNDICCDQNIEDFDHKQPKYMGAIKTDLLVQNIKSETYVDGENISQNACPNNFFITIDGLKSYEAKTACIETSVDVTRIKNENDEDSDEISVSNLETLPCVARKRKLNHAKSKPKRMKSENSKRTKQTQQRDVKLAVSKDNYIVTEMTEEEMEAKREADRQADRYKNKVKFRCELCISGFFHKELFEKHMRIRHSEKAGKYQCDVCATRFKTVSLYREHLEIHYRKYRCKLCSYVGYTLTEMVSHDAREHGVKRFSCKLCKEEFPLRSRLRFHRETMHEAPVKCESCGKTFRTRDSLRIHVKQMHSHNPKTPCPVCGARVRNMKSHSRVHEAAPEAAYCAECDKRFTSTASYKSHLKYSAPHRAPDTVLSHECRVCGARFVNAVGLKKHALRRHSNVRPHKCDRCGKGFEEGCKLKQHILHAHEGVEKPRDKICHICGRGFTTKLTLSNHIRVHTGEKPFRCEICGAAFSQKSSLTTHTRGVHLKIKPRPGNRGNNA